MSCLAYKASRCKIYFSDYTVAKIPVLVATSIKQATCIEQARIHSPKKVNTLKSTSSWAGLDLLSG